MSSKVTAALALIVAIIFGVMILDLRSKVDSIKGCNCSEKLSLLSRKVENMEGDVADIQRCCTELCDVVNNSGGLMQGHKPITLGKSSATKPTTKEPPK